MLYRPTSTFHGVPIPTRIGRCQPPVIVDTFKLPIDCKGFHCIPYVLLSRCCSSRAHPSQVFDRMFSLGVRGSGTDTAPLAAAAAVAGSTSGPRRHFLFCSLKKGEPGASSAGKGRRSREMLQ